MVTKCQAHRLDDQRSSLPMPQSHELEDDLFDMLWQLQGTRIEDQRSVMSVESPPHIMPQGTSQEQPDDELFEMIFTCQVCLCGCHVLIFYSHSDSVWNVWQEISLSDH